MRRIVCHRVGLLGLAACSVMLCAQASGEAIGKSRDEPEGLLAAVFDIGECDVQGLSNPGWKR